MIKKTNLISICFFTCFTYFISAQKSNDEILLTVNGNPIKASEFIRVYKKNLNLVKDDSQKDVDSYLKLFINYKLKVEEARALGYDKKETFKKELKNYREQLAKNYLTDHQVTEALVKEAYERSAYRVKASHILITLPEYEQDTIAAYNKILQLRKRLIDQGFEKLKAEVHNGSTTFVEDLGYFSTFNMVYDFETVAFNTKVGDISQPFRTRFGYHVVQVFDKKKSKGEVTIGHIVMFKTTKDNLANAKERIHKVYDLMQQGQAFEDLARQFSEDKNSAAKGGKLGTVKEGDIRLKIFEDTAFALTEANPISKPIKTDRSWHIIKLYHKTPYGSFESLKNDLEKQVKRDSRSARISSALIGNLLEYYGLTYDTPELPYFKTIVNQTYFNNNWRIPTDLPKHKVLFNIKNEVYTFNDFALYIENSQKQNKIQDIEILVETLYKNFINNTVFDYHKSNLEFENTDFANVLLEFEEGLLLFELMENNIWNLSTTDSLGLREFYNNNKSNYNEEAKIDAVLATATDASDLKKIKKLWSKGLDATSKDNSVTITKAVYEVGDAFLPQDFQFKTGVSSIFKAEGKYHLIKVNKVFPKRIKMFKEVKGIVTNDYQKFVEKQWLKTLTNKHEININNDVLNKIKNQLN